MEEKDCKPSCSEVPEINKQEDEFSENVKQKQKNQDYLLDKKKILPYGVGPVIDCEIDDEDNEPDYSTYARKRPKKIKTRPKKKKFLAYGVGPDIDCEIDDDSDEPDYLSYTVIPKKLNLVEDSSTSKNATP